MITIYHNNARSKDLKILEKPKEGVWVHVEDPTDDEISKLTEMFKLDDSLLQDALDPYESPRIEIEDSIIYVFTRYCETTNSQLSTIPMLFIYGGSFLITLTTEQFKQLPNFTDQKIEFLTTQKTKLLLSFLSEINMTYRRQLNRLSRTILGVRSQLNKASINNQDFVEMIDIEEDLNEILSSLIPQNVVMRSIMSGKFMKLYEEDKDLVEDISLGIIETIELTQSRLKNIRNIRDAYSTIMANNLNRVIKLMTTITIMISIPTVVSSLYGMNVALPEANEPWIFWAIVGFVTTMLVTILVLFKRAKWL